MATVVGVFAALASGIIAYNLGLFDVKRIELESRKNALTNENALLELKKSQLESERLVIETRIKDTENRYAQYEKSTKAKIAELTTQIQTYETAWKKVERENAAVNTLRALSYYHEFGDQKGEYLKANIDFNIEYGRRNVEIVAKRNDGKELRLPTNPPQIHSAILALADIQGLNGVGITGIALNAADLKTIAQLPSLQSLTLSGCELTDGLLQSMSLPDSLESLDLSDNRISGLPSSWIFREGISIELQNNPIDDVGAIRLAEQFPKCKQINLTGTQVTDACLEPLLKLPELRGIRLSRTKLTTTAGKMLFALPDRADGDLRLFVVDEVAVPGDLKDAINSLRDRKTVIVTTESQNGNRPITAY